MCVTDLVYIFTVGAGSVFAYIGGVVFSIGVNLSLNSVAYSLDFLSSAWTAVRDIANIAFIFMLIYLAFVIMLGAETHGTNRMLATIIVMALLINFSFFITRVVIDAGNVLAVQFYNAIPANTIDQNSGFTGARLAGLVTAGNTKDLTQAIMGVVDVTKALNTTSFDKFRQSIKNSHGAVGGFLIIVIALSILYIVIGLMFAVLATIFFFVGFKFIYRVIALWFVIVSAPAAFAARAFTLNRNTQTFFEYWKTTLIQMTFYPAIFLFSFLIITFILQQMGANAIQGVFEDFNSVQGSAANSSNFLWTLGRVLGSMIIRLGIIYILIFYGLKVADMVVKQGNTIANTATGWTTRRLAGATYGGAGYIGRYTLGAGARKIAPNVQTRASTETGLRGTLWRGANALNKKAATGSYDVRGAGGGRLRSVVMQSTRFDVGTPGVSDKTKKRNTAFLDNLKKIDKNVQKQQAQVQAEKEKADAKTLQQSGALNKLASREETLRNAPAGLGGLANREEAQRTQAQGASNRTQAAQAQGSSAAGAASQARSQTNGGIIDSSAWTGRPADAPTPAGRIAAIFKRMPPGKTGPAPVRSAGEQETPSEAPETNNTNQAENQDTSGTPNESAAVPGTATGAGRAATVPPPSTQNATGTGAFGSEEVPPPATASTAGVQAVSSSAAAALSELSASGKDKTPIPANTSVAPDKTNDDTVRFVIPASEAGVERRADNDNYTPPTPPVGPAARPVALNTSTSVGSTQLQEVMQRRTAATAVPEPANTNNPDTRPPTAPSGVMAIEDREQETPSKPIVIDASAKPSAAPAAADSDLFKEGSAWEAAKAKVKEKEIDTLRQQEMRERLKQNKETRRLLREIRSQAAHTQGTEVEQRVEPEQAEETPGTNTLDQAA